MRNPALRLSEPDPALLKKLALIEQGYLAVVALIALCALGARFVPALAHLLPGDWVPMPPQVAVSTLVIAVALELSRPGPSRLKKHLGFVLAAAVALLAVSVLLKGLFGISIGLDRYAASPANAAQPAMPVLVAGAFLSLADGIMMLRARKGLASHLADAFVFVYCILVLLLVSAYAFQGPQPASAAGGVSVLTLLSLALLAFVGFIRRAESGAFAAFLGAGSGSRIARVAAPLVLLVPFLPQAALGHVLGWNRLRIEHLSEIADFLAAGLSIAVMLYMAVRINRLERKVRELSLRDELTGLYNRRGFHLVAWQALRQARRSGLPFSVMFVAVENLPQINETNGYRAGTELLIEMANILTSAFRDTDVIGRVDPDQFALAGHFGGAALNIMRLRLQEAVNYRNSNPGRSVNLSFSAGCVDAGDPRRESLEELIARADEAREQEFEAPESIAPSRRRDTR